MNCRKFYTFIINSVFFIKAKLFYKQMDIVTIIEIILGGEVMGQLITKRNDERQQKRNTALTWIGRKKMPITIKEESYRVL